MLTSFHRKSRILECSLDLSLENMICKHGAIWPSVAYRVIRVRIDLAAR